MTTPLPIPDTERERLLVKLLDHLADDHRETVTMDVDVAAWLLNSLSDDELAKVAQRIISKNERQCKCDCGHAEDGWICSACGYPAVDCGHHQPASNRKAGQND